jgi:hypothetical protein
MSDLEHSETESASHPVSADLPHRPADDREEVYYEGSPLIRGAVAKGVLWELLGIVLIAIPIVLHFVSRRQINLLVFVIPIVLGFIVLCIPALRALTFRYRITNYRIDYERGLIGKDIDTLELWHVEDITFHQSILDRLLGIGSIGIISHDMTTPKLVMHSLPMCRPLFEKLKQRIIAVKRQRGVVKMDTGT